MSTPILHFVVSHSCVDFCKSYNLCRFRLIIPIVSKDLCGSCDEFCNKLSASLVVDEDKSGIGDFMNLGPISMSTVYDHFLYNSSDSDLGDNGFTILAVFGVVSAVGYEKTFRCTAAKLIVVVDDDIFELVDVEVFFGAN